MAGTYELKRERIAPDIDLVMTVTFTDCGPALVQNASFRITAQEKNVELPDTQAVFVKNEKTAARIFDLIRVLMRRVLVE